MRKRSRGLVMALVLSTATMGIAPSAFAQSSADKATARQLGIEGEDGEAVAARWLDEAARRKGWLVLFTHDVRETPSPFGCTPQVLERLADKARDLGFEVVTLAEGARRIGAT